MELFISQDKDIGEMNRGCFNIVMGCNNKRYPLPVFLPDQFAQC